MTVICDWCQQHGDSPSVCFSFLQKCGICGESRCSRHRLRLVHSFSRRTIYVCHDKHLDATIGELLTSAKTEVPV